MPRHEQTCLLGYRPSPNKPHDVDHDHYDIYRGYSNFLLNMASISSSEVENSGEATNEIYIIFTSRVK